MDKVLLKPSVIVVHLCSHLDESFIVVYRTTEVSYRLLMVQCHGSHKNTVCLEESGLVFMFVLLVCKHGCALVRLLFFPFTCCTGTYIRR